MLFGILILPNTCPVLALWAAPPLFENRQGKMTCTFLYVFQQVIWGNTQIRTRTKS
jgi:hypothetical protein